MNALHRGENAEHLGELYPLASGFGLNRERYEPKVKSEDSKIVTEQRNIALNVFIKFTVPLTLFIFALSLKLPQIIWIWLSSFGPININKTFESFKAGPTLNADSRLMLQSDLVKVTEEATHNTNRLATGYLFCKLLVCVVIAAEMLIIMRVTLPVLNELQTGNVEQNMSSNGNYTEVEKPEEDSVVLACVFSISRLQNVERNTMQCLFTKDSGEPANESFLWGYRALLTAVLTHLVVLQILNVVSLVTWICKLAVGEAQSLDMRFVILMSKENNDPILTRSFEENLVLLHE